MDGQTSSRSRLLAGQRAAPLNPRRCWGNTRFSGVDREQLRSRCARAQAGPARGRVAQAPKRSPEARRVVGGRWTPQALTASLCVSMANSCSPNSALIMPKSAAGQASDAFRVACGTSSILAIPHRVHHRAPCTFSRPLARFTWPLAESRGPRAAPAGTPVPAKGSISGATAPVRLPTAAGIARRKRARR